MGCLTSFGSIVIVAEDRPSVALGQRRSFRGIAGLDTRDKLLQLFAQPMRAVVVRGGILAARRIAGAARLERFRADAVLRRFEVESNQNWWQSSKLLTKVRMHLASGHRGRRMWQALVSTAEGVYECAGQCEIRLMVGLLEWRFLETTSPVQPFYAL